MTSRLLLSCAAGRRIAPRRAARHVRPVFTPLWLRQLRPREKKSPSSDKNKRTNLNVASLAGCDWTERRFNPGVFLLMCLKMGPEGIVIKTECRSEWPSSATRRNGFTTDILSGCQPRLLSRSRFRSIVEALAPDHRARASPFGSGATSTEEGRSHVQETQKKVADCGSVLRRRKQSRFTL